MLLELLRLARAWFLTLTCGLRKHPIIPDNTTPWPGTAVEWPLYHYSDGTYWRACWCGQNGERAY